MTALLFCSIEQLARLRVGGFNRPLGIDKKNGIDAVFKESAKTLLIVVQAILRRQRFGLNDRLLLRC